MTTISVLPPSAPGAAFRAFANGTEATGETLGRALDALSAAVGPPNGAAVIIVQPAGGDQYFSAAQQQRLNELMVRWRAARDSRASLPAGEQAELDALIAAELEAATTRSAALAADLRP